VESFFFVAAAEYSQLFCELLRKYLLVNELHIAHIIRWVLFRQQFSVAESCMHGSLFMQEKSKKVILLVSTLTMWRCAAK